MLGELIREMFSLIHRVGRVSLHWVGLMPLFVMKKIKLGGT